MCRTSHRASGDPWKSTVPDDQGDGCDTPERSYFTNLHRSQRRTCIHGRYHHRSQHYRNDRKGHARTSSECILLFCRGRQIYGGPAILQKTASDEGRQRQAALLAFSAFSELKHIFLVDEDVDCFDMNDVLWAMNTRFQGDVDIITIPGVRCHPLDPSNDPDFSPSIRDHGIACKTIFDCTVPFSLKERFQRAQLLDVDPSPWMSGQTVPQEPSHWKPI